LSPEEHAKLNRMAHNRAKKHFHRQQLLADYARIRHDQAHKRESAAIETRDEVNASRRRVSVADWGMLLLLADRTPYQTLADELGVLIGTLKAKVSRAREQIREYAPVCG